MRTDGTRWNNRIKLVLHELEKKMQRDENSGRDGVWPAPEEVEAWTAQRRAQSREGGQRRDARRGEERGAAERRREAGNSGLYCGNSVYEDGQTKENIRRKGFVQTIMLQAAKSAAFALATIALLQGIGRVLPDSVTVSNTVNGRELPIYCVQTDEKKVALSFDAAWENSRLRNGILIVHIEYYVCLLADELTSANHFFI